MSSDTSQIYSYFDILYIILKMTSSNRYVHMYILEQKIRSVDSRFPTFIKTGKGLGLRCKKSFANRWRVSISKIKLSLAEIKKNLSNKNQLKSENKALEEIALDGNGPKWIFEVLFKIHDLTNIFT